jgi:copper(I)-binding protein
MAVALSACSAVTSDMSAIYGELKNGSNADVTVGSATSNVATMAHFILTTTDASGVTSSSESARGFLIPAGGTLQLAAGIRTCPAVAAAGFNA